MTEDEYDTITEQTEEGETPKEVFFDYNEALEHTFYLVSACECYIENRTFTGIDDDVINEEQLIENADNVTISTPVVIPLN